MLNLVLSEKWNRVFLQFKEPSEGCSPCQQKVQALLLIKSKYTIGWLSSGTFSCNVMCVFQLLCYLVISVIYLAFSRTSSNFAKTIIHGFPNICVEVKTKLKRFSHADFSSGFRKLYDRKVFDKTARALFTERCTCFAHHTCFCKFFCEMCIRS